MKNWDWTITLLASLVLISCQKLKVRKTTGEYHCEITIYSSYIYNDTIEVKGAGDHVNIFGWEFPMKDLRKGDPISVGAPMGGQLTARLPKKSDSLYLNYLSISPGGYYAENYRCKKIP